jgi:predicted nicotinamide N-methyase
MASFRVCYQTIEFDEIDIHLRTLRDRQEYCDIDGAAEKLGISSALWPIFGVVWPSSIVLTHFLLAYPYKNKRILEVGCGIGLVSLLLNYFEADITATDIHPEAEQFLQENVRLNKGKAIPFLRCGWGDLQSRLGEFDLIVGSDLLYEDEHADLLSSFIEQHSNSHCDVIIVDPGRSSRAKFCKKMVGLNFSHSQQKFINPEYLDKPYRGYVLQFSR